jgi:hypothetical protein
LEGTAAAAAAAAAGQCDLATSITAAPRLFDCLNSYKTHQRKRERCAPLQGLLCPVQHSISHVQQGGRDGTGLEWVAAHLRRRMMRGQVRCGRTMILSTDVCKFQWPSVRVLGLACCCSKVSRDSTLVTPWHYYLMLLPT